jgi:hypothetical protein
MVSTSLADVVRSLGVGKDQHGTDIDYRGSRNWSRGKDAAAWTEEWSESGLEACGQMTLMQTLGSVKDENERHRPSAAGSLG